MLADEPVSMLDVSIRLEILNLLDALKRDRNLALLYITHDLATARHFSSRIMVMYRGEIVEQGPADEVILNPAHPYTQLLESAVPHGATSRDRLAAQRRARLPARKTAPAAERREATADTGCRFRARCPHAMADLRHPSARLRRAGGAYGAMLAARPGRRCPRAARERPEPVSSRPCAPKSAAPPRPARSPRPRRSARHTDGSPQASASATSSRTATRYATAGLSPFLRHLGQPGQPRTAPARRAPPARVRPA